MIFGDYLDALLRHLDGGFEDRARLHFGDLGIGDAQTASAMTQHGIEFVQLFDAMQQFGQRLLQILHRDLVALRHFLLRFDIGMRKHGDIDHQVFALGQEFVQRRIERADDDGESVHRFEEAGEIGTLHGQELVECFAPRFFVARRESSPA